MAAIERIASESVWVPRDDPLSFASLDSRHHVVEHRATRLLSGEPLLELAHDVEAASSSEFPELGILFRNGADLPRFVVRGLANVYKIFGIFVRHMCFDKLP